MATGEFVGSLEYKEEVMKVLEADFWLMHVSTPLKSTETCFMCSNISLLMIYLVRGFDMHVV